MSWSVVARRYACALVALCSVAAVASCVRPGAEDASSADAVAMDRALGSDSANADVAASDNGDSLASLDAGVIVDAASRDDVRSAPDGASDAAIARFEFDLDLDAIADSTFVLAPCRAAPSRFCAVARSTLAAVDGREWLLAESAVFTGAYAEGFYAIGRHDAGALQEIALAYHRGDDQRLEVRVLFPDSPATFAWVASPVGWTLHNTWFAMVRGPGGRRFPFIAPGQGYVPPHDGSSDWSFGCLFDPARLASGALDPACGTGFQSFGARLGAVVGLPSYADTGFRHHGGFLEDVDGDGFDDIHLPYLWALHTVSGRPTAGVGAPAALASNAWDVSLQTEPMAPAGFHSGRQYGVMSTFALGAGQRGLLVTGGNPVGSFSDVYCGVSRYHAVVRWPEGRPAERSLVWSRYRGFAKHTFRTPLPPVGTAATILRRGDQLHGCVHHHGGALFNAGSRPVTVYSWFESSPPADQCTAEQEAEVRSGFAAADAARWTLCAERAFLPTVGRWRVQVDAVDNGEGLNSIDHAYVWGSSARLVAATRVYLVEHLAGPVRFDRVGVASTRLRAYTIESNGTWRSVGEFPVEGVAQIRAVYPAEGNVGQTSRGLAELVTEDRDGDGLDEVQLASGAWVRWDASSSRFVLR